MSIPDVGLRADIRQQLSFGYDCMPKLFLIATFTMRRTVWS
jgi:hypothetical protein